MFAYGANPIIRLIILYKSGFMTEVELRSILSLNIKRYRNKHNLSQADLAEKLDISVNFLCNIENGNKWMSPMTLVKFASALEIEPYELFKPEESLPPDVSSALTRYTNEAICAITDVLHQIKGYYINEAKTPPKD
jgi:transcriptional regulator with XRE-family HTH domain